MSRSSVDRSNSSINRRGFANRLARGKVAGFAVAGGVAMLFTALLAAVPAAADAATTGVTFTLDAGGLAITVPATAALGHGVPGTNMSGSLGAVTVTDSRGLAVAAWTATASTSTFVTGGGTAPETLAKSAVLYASGLATATTGLSLVLLPGQLTSLLSAPMTTAVTAYALTAGIGNNSATWNPTITIAIPASAVSGPYTGTITHSIA